jgi:hypothetical protein
MRVMNLFRKSISSAAFTILLLACFCVAGETPRSPSTLEEVLAAKTDMWGQEAMRQPGGPTYEFFASLLPPLRYVNAQFRHYPIVLSAPESRRKARLVSNGSAVNARGKLWSWYEVGIPVEFRVGEQQKIFGEELDRLTGPKYEDGWLPVVTLDYREGNTVYREESFAPADAPLAEQGAVFLRFSLASGSRGIIRAVVQPEKPLKLDSGRLVDDKGRAWFRLGAGWQWDAATASLTARLTRATPAILAVFTEPAAQAVATDLSAAMFDREHQRCTREWRDILGRAAGIDLPEPVVQNAWRALIVGTLMLASGKEMNYSAGNQYERMYAEESSSPVHALAMFGLNDKVRMLLDPILSFDKQPDLKFHNAAFQLQMLSGYYWLTHDAAYVRSNRNLWKPLIDSIVAGREKDTGLLPKENYCGDISTKVHSLNSNANCWRALRDMAAILTEVGEPDTALESTAREYRKSILEAVARSESHEVTPPFIPIALFGAEKPYETLTASMLGSYWILISNYLLRSGIFDAQPEKADWIAEYLERHGGLAMGMMRFDQHSKLFANENGLDDLYTLGYMLYLAQRDRPDPLLVTFYGKLAQGLTRDTFIGGEGTGLVPLDRHGRPMYMPPNASGNALWLWTLRCLMVQDFDLDDDGRPETLRLLPATPRGWLRDGAAIRLRNMPTAFGTVSLTVTSRLSKGEVLADLTLPARASAKTLLRFRLPPGWKPVKATNGGSTLPMSDDGTVELTPLRGQCRIRLAVRAK